MFPIKRSVLSYFLEPDQTPPLVPKSAASTPQLTTPTKLTSTPQPDPTPFMDIFCDGACIGNGTHRARAGFGVYVKLDGKHFTQVSEALERSELHTNQRAELRGLQRALEFAAEAPPHLHIRIFTDSMYSINCITKWADSWRKRDWCKSGQKEEILNKDIIIPTYALWLSVIHRTEIEHVRSHTGKSDWKSVGNQRADELASAALHS
jgi:ribonuclease HI